MSGMTLEAFQLRCGSEADCAELLFQARWPEGFRCPCCGHSQATAMDTRRLPLYECRRCLRQTSLTAGTVMEKSRTPLSKWLFAMRLMSESDHGVNAVELQRLLNVAYKTAFHMLRKLRLALGAAGNRRLLDGHVRAGVDYLSRLELSSRALGEGRKHPVITAVSIDAAGLPKQVDIASVPPAHMDGMLLIPRGKLHFLQQRVSPQAATVEVACSLLLTNRHCGYIRSYGKSVRQWINDIFHGVSNAYLQTYLDEFVFRLNARLQNDPPLQRLMDACLRAPFTPAAPARRLHPTTAA